MRRHTVPSSGCVKKHYFPLLLVGCIILVTVSDTLLSPTLLTLSSGHWTEKLSKQMPSACFCLYLCLVGNPEEVPHERLLSLTLPYSSITTDGLLSHHALENITLQVTRLQLFSQAEWLTFVASSKFSTTKHRGFSCT